MNEPIRIHPANPKCFEFRGRPVVLVTATEHYGAVMNRPFRFERYLADAAERGITLSRLFVLFRELQNAVNPYSTCKPESPDYISPFERTGPGLALDGEPKYDLDRWNGEFFDRLHRFLSLASDGGIVVEIVLFSNTYGEGIWALNPLNGRNNVNGLADIAWPEYMSLRRPELFARQERHARRIVEETKRYDNVIYEICNEPGGLAGPGLPTLEEVNQWQMALREVVVEAEADLPHKHLIAGQEAFAYSLPDESGRSGPDVHQFADRSFDSLGFDVVNMHPLSNMIHRGRHYDLGQFMRGRLRLDALRQYCLHLYRERKPFNLDEDNAASRYKDVRGWTIHRKRAWTTLLCGGHYDMIDFSIINYCETGTADSRRGIRAWMGHLARFVHSMDLVRARPLDASVKPPPHTVASVFGVEGEDYCIYLADAREWDEGTGGETIGGEIAIDLPDGRFVMSCYSPATGLYSPAAALTGKKDLRIALPDFQDDLVIRFRREVGRT